MLNYLFQLPHVHIWLPIMAALVASLPVLWFLRPARGAGTASSGTDATGLGPRPLDPFDHGSKSEKRKACRRQGNVIKVVWALATAPDELSRGYVVDRSTAGLRLLLPDQLAEGTVVLVRPATAAAESPWAQLEVRTCMPSAIQGDEFEIGCQYVKTPSFAILSLFG